MFFCNVPTKNYVSKDVLYINKFRNRGSSLIYMRNYQRLNDSTGIISLEEISKCLRGCTKTWEESFHKYISILEEEIGPVRQIQYHMNPKYSLMVKEEIDKLLEAWFFYKVPYSEWVSLIVVVPKKNGKLRLCQDFRKLNSVTRKYYFLLPLTGTILDAITRYKHY